MTVSASTRAAVATMIIMIGSSRWSDGVSGLPVHGVVLVLGFCAKPARYVVDRGAGFLPKCDFAISRVECGTG